MFVIAINSTTTGTVSTSAVITKWMLQNITYHTGIFAADFVTGSATNSTQVTYYIRCVMKLTDNQIGVIARKGTTETTIKWFMFYR